MLILVALLVVAACSGGGTSSGADATAPAITTATPSTVPVTTVPATTAPVTTAPVTTVPVTTAPVSPLDERIEFVAAALTDPTIATDETLAEQFAPVFLAAVPPADIRAVLADPVPGASGPWRVVERTGGPTSAVVTLVSGDALLTLSIEIEPGGAGRIVGAVLQPGSVTEISDAFASPGTADEVDQALTSMADRVVYAVYDAADGACTPLLERGGDTVAPTGSTFKLWVLAALARAVEAGDASWDETMAVERAYRSSPDGEVYPLEDGTEVTLRRLAELMISISDNTATDHLIARLGRDSIEVTIADLGISTVDRNIPFLTTAELFALKFVDAGLAERYLAIEGADARRAFLDDVVQATPLPWIDDPDWTPSAPLTTPVLVDELEWFATPLDICTTFHDLDRLAATPGLEPVGEILAINPGLPIPEDDWSTIRFKGGSEPGVAMLAYWLEAPTGERRVVVLGLSDDVRTFTDIEVALAGARLLGLAATTVD